MKELKKMVTNLKNRKYKLLNKNLQQVLIEIVKFIVSNMTKFKKRLKQLSTEETGKIINKDRKKVRQSKKKLKGNTDKMLETKKLNAISKTILAKKEKSDGVSNFRGVPSPSSSTGVQSVSPSKGVLNGVVRRGAGSTEKTREKKEKQKLWIKTFMGKIPSQHKQNKKTTTRNRKARRRTTKEITTEKSTESPKLNSNQNLKSTQQPKKEENNKR